MVKFTSKVKGPFVTLIKISIHLIECISRHDSNPNPNPKDKPNRNTGPQVTTRWFTLRLSRHLVALILSKSSMDLIMCISGHK